MFAFYKFIYIHIWKSIIQLLLILSFWYNLDEVRMKFRWSHGIYDSLCHPSGYHYVMLALWTAWSSPISHVKHSNHLSTATIRYNKTASRPHLCLYHLDILKDIVLQLLNDCLKKIPSFKYSNWSNGALDDTQFSFHLSQLDLIEFLNYFYGFWANCFCGKCLLFIRKVLSACAIRLKLFSIIRIKIGT